MTDFFTVLRQWGAIGVGTTGVVIFGFLLWLLMKHAITNPGWRTLGWSVVMLVVIVVVMRWVAPTQSTAIYEAWRNWYMDVISRDVEVAMRNTGTAAGIGDNGTSNFRPLDQLAPSSGSNAAPQDSQPAPQFNTLPVLPPRLESAPEPEVAPQNAPDGADVPSSSSAQPDVMMGGDGRILASCRSDGCPNGGCPQGCRGPSTWIYNGVRYGMVCNASQPMQDGAWVRTEIGSPVWNRGYDCPSTRR